jgi:hypothetical protein
MREILVLSKGFSEWWIVYISVIVSGETWVIAFKVLAVCDKPFRFNWMQSLEFVANKCVINIYWLLRETRVHEIYCFPKVPLNHAVFYSIQSAKVNKKKREASIIFCFITRWLYYSPVNKIHKSNVHSPELLPGDSRISWFSRDTLSSNEIQENMNFESLTLSLVYNNKDWNNPFGNGLQNFIPFKLTVIL